MSLPLIGLPVPALGVGVFFVCTFLFIYCHWLAERGYKKTHDRFQPWVFVEIKLNATSLHGVAAYDDDNAQQNNLQRFFQHGWPE
jgi:hypothetical protein